MRRIHIVGCGPRSGTTLMFEIMKACFEIDHYGGHESAIHAWPERDAKVFLTKRPMDIMVVEPALRWMPALHVIYMIRDPRDMCVSKHGSDPGRYWSSLTYWKTYTPFGKRLEGHPRFIPVRYEDLVSDPDSIQALLMKRLPFLVMRCPFSNFHRVAEPSAPALLALKGMRPVSSARVGTWRRHLPRIAAQMALHGPLTESLIEYGYENDDSWEAELVGIEPDFSASHWPEHYPPKSFRMVQRRKYPAALLAVLGQSSLLRRLKARFRSADDR